MTRIIDILNRSRDTIVGDALGVVTLAAFTTVLLHIPGFV